MSVALSELSLPGSQYTDMQKQQAAIEYCILGNLQAVSDSIGIPRRTLNDWRTAQWFIDLVTELRHSRQDEHITKYLALVDAAQARTMEALPDATAAQASIIAATATDKARLLLNMPTSIRGDSATVQSLAEQFRQLSRDHQAIQSSVVSSQPGGLQDTIDDEAG